MKNITLTFVFNLLARLLIGGALAMLLISCGGGNEQAAGPDSASGQQAQQKSQLPSPVARLQVASSTTAETWTTCADEGSLCSFTGTRKVRYGANGLYFYRTATDSIQCTNAVFGDPAPGSLKTCSYSSTTTTSPAPDASWINCANEGALCSFTGTRKVRYGANGLYFYRTATNSIQCTNAVFGDPAQGSLKTCSYSSTTTTSPAPDASWINCANEGALCSFTGTQQVRYGANGTYFYRTATGSIQCTNSVFGDPLPYVIKSCSYSSTAPTPTPTPTPTTGAPYVVYTDVISGPTSGGEGNNGAYLSIFGKNFGGSGLGTTTTVKIGGVEVASYRFLGASKVAGIQQIMVQVGALGGAAQGVALPIQVTVGGKVSNTNVIFMPNPGRILYVDNVAGNDATAIPGNIAKPYRYVQTPALYTGGAWAVAQPGDMIVMRGHGNANPWTDVGFEHYFMRFRNKSGSAPTGAPGTGAIVLAGYPGEDTYIHGTLASGMTGGCISGINGQSFTGMGQWAVISNLRIDCEGYDGPISQQIWGHNWRIVNNELSENNAPRTGGSVPRMAGITGNGNNAVWYGNHIHDIQGSSGECHGIYIDGDGSYDIAYNQIHDIRDGNGFQVYVNGGNGSEVANNINFHHNLIHDVSKHGVNLADGTQNNVKVWNNLVYNVQFAAVRFNTTDLSGAKIFNNTFYKTNMNGNSAYGALTNDWNLPAGAMDVENNIFYVATGTPYNSGSVNVPAGAGTFAHNVWFNGSGSPSIDSTAVTLNPLFVTPGLDFHLQALSPAIQVGSHTAAVTSLVTTDFDINARSSTVMDIGALKY